MERPIDERILKVPLPARLIREVDEAIVAGLGGYSTRAEFFRDAAEGLLLELKYEPAPDPAAPTARGAKQASVERTGSSHEGPDTSVTEPGAMREQDGRWISRIPRIEGTRLHLGELGEPMTDGEAEVADEPLFGMHNRDYPSLWVAFRLAERTAHGPVPYDAFVDDVTEEAWEYAAALLELEEATGSKLTALFPTNQAKPQSARDGFRTFAVGSVVAGANGIRADGPAFAWRIFQVKRAQGGEIVLSLTEVGLELLKRLDGLSLETPHAASMAETFLRHVRTHAPGDWWGFQTVLSAVAEQPTRVELVDSFQRGRPDWSPNVAATNAQGYVARAREWGLVEPKQVGGRYGLTELGAGVLEGALDGNAVESKGGSDR
jgi:hypothetical protein